MLCGFWLPAIRGRQWLLRFTFSTLNLPLWRAFCELGTPATRHFSTFMQPVVFRIAESFLTLRTERNKLNR